MSDFVLAYLMERQVVEDLSGVEMARRLGVSETQWSHFRTKRVGLGVRQIERALKLYPEIGERLAERARIPVAS